ncbi:hypothetical protein DYU05_04300 [Mucilaginibacter terrenus]|uniref:DUF3244 domain-containing protein n=1 Tax=Mucilaginibacter terrenus TaxID=2482727 RepID=A0A3E2NV06_9SPHI|nr:hypothetical protein [Mucilaginibacter terrenus]RFZ84835.1 hypothetical protein DYU05_04300 [Mucilaginibacter terrenus]
MKNSIKLTALLLLASTGLFAATTVKADPIQDEITVAASARNLVVDLKIAKETTGKTYVTFYDDKNSELMRDYLSAKHSVAKAYNLSDLEPGNYTMAVTSNNQVVTKQLNVFMEFGKKTYVFLQ